jgi:hypothetical protein
MLPTEDELRERYAAYPNNRLLLIMHNKDEYTPQALEIARAELAGRDISTADVDVFLDEQEERELAAKAIAAVPLAFAEKALFFFVWFAPWFLGRALRMNYNEDGYALKARQSHVYSLGGFVCAVACAAISVIFDVNIPAGILLIIAFFFLFVWLEKKVVYTLTL